MTKISRLSCETVHIRNAELLLPKCRLKGR
jgi:hypothetical protein